ncbi:MAG: DUF2786 domain-containing protein [Halobacteriovoraceae bacterium]|jgi:hypothetical protein|nr:DUF2786 domain-containing protein [Halobacteriovoraceae bacterium]MBT5092934.1 DUF2786 domain-containing protein [Halobacteriovoraceae bacterium]
MGMLVNRSRVEYCGHTIPFHIVVFESSSSLGYFDSNTYQIGIHKKLMTGAKNEVILNVLRHELAHFVTYLKYRNSKKPHGPEFKQICHSYGWGAEVSSAYSNLELENSKIESNHKELRLLEKVKKLLALASSCNKFEAETATLKANELLYRHNLELCQLDQQDFHSLESEETVYVKRVLEAKRNNGKLHAIYEILQNFFVQPVFNHGKGICYLEVVGSKVNVEMADYVASFLDNEIDHLWNKARESDPFFKGISKKNSFMRGLALGFCEKLKESKEKIPPGSLVLLQKNLSKSLELVYSRLGHSATRTSSNCSVASGLGKELGRGLSIRPGVKNSSSQTLLLD